MGIVNNYSISDLKEALSRNINQLRKKYRYTNMSIYNFEQIVTKSLEDINVLYSSKTGESIDIFFEKRVDAYMNKYIRKRLICDNSIIDSYICTCDVNTIDIPSCNECVENISKIYENSFYVPSYDVVNNLFSSSKKLNEIFLTYFGSIRDYKNVYKGIPNTMKTYIEVFADKNDIDLISLIVNQNNVGINRLNDLSNYVKSDDKLLFEYISLKKSLVDNFASLFDIDDKNDIKNFLDEYIRSREDSKIRGGLLLNTIRLSLEKSKNSSYCVEEFINTYDKHLEFALLDDYMLPLKTLKKGVYKFLNDFSFVEIEKTIKQLPQKYLDILYRSYGKSLKYFTFNENLGQATLKKLSVILITMLDYIKYKNNDYKPQINIESDNLSFKKNDTVMSQLSDKNKCDFSDALSDLKNINFNDILNMFTPTEKIIIMLKLGCIDDKEYSDDMISSFLSVDTKMIYNTLLKFISIYKSNLIKDIDNMIEGYQIVKKK